METITLHNYFKSSCSWRVRLGLELKGEYSKISTMVPYQFRTCVLKFYLFQCHTNFSCVPTNHCVTRGTSFKKTIIFVVKLTNHSN